MTAADRPGVLQDTVSVITGAGRGIGRAIALEYAKEGSRVAVTSRTAANVAAVVAEIRAAGGQAIGIPCDVSEKDQIQDMVGRVVAEFGTVDVLVNNAQGFGSKAAPTASSPVTRPEEVTDEEWDFVFDTGVKATLRAMQAVFPHMKAAGGGRIINFGSRRGIIGITDSTAYNANKEAIRALSRTCANAWGRHGINVNVMNPAIETDAARSEFEKFPGLRERLEKEIPLRRWGQPYDCARVAVFLAGPDSSYLTGMTFMVEGGLTTLP
jgi:NAD(P)-dependent dehydrogenase (short-subunit alcohol dehydrogenase family)